MVKTNRVRKQFLNHLIDTQLLADQATKQGLEKDPKFVKLMNRLKILSYLCRKRDRKATTDKH